MLSKGIQYMLVASLLFAMMNVCIKLVKHLPVAETMLFRSGIQILLTLPLLWYQKVSLKGVNQKLLLARGVTGTFALFCYVYTLQTMPLASAMTLYYLAPIMTLIVAKFLYHEHFAKIQWIFFLVSFVGVVLVKGFDPRVDLIQLGIGISGAIISGFSYNFIRQLRTTDHTLVVVLYFPLISFPIALVFCGLGYWQMPQGWDWLWFILIGITTQLGQICLTLAYKHEQASRVVVVSYIGIIYASTFGFLWFDEQHNWVALLGMGLVVGGLVASAIYKSVSHKLKKTP